MEVFDSSFRDLAQVLIDLEVIAGEYTAWGLDYDTGSTAVESYASKFGVDSENKR